MLGLSEFGETNLGGYPESSYLSKVTETVNSSENISSSLSTKISEIITADDTATLIRILIVLVQEIMAVSEKVKSSLTITLKETIKSLDTVKNAISTKIIETISLFDTTVVAKTLIILVQEIMGLSEKITTKINGVVVFWEACLEKGVAIVTNFYRKYRE